MIASEDAYAIIGVDKDADEAAIKKAYRMLAMKYHPDRVANNKDMDDAEKELAEDAMAKINTANTILNDAEKRDLFDKYGWESAVAGEALGRAKASGFRPDANAGVQAFGGDQMSDDDLFGSSGPSRAREGFDMSAGRKRRRPGGRRGGFQINRGGAKSAPANDTKPKEEPVFEKFYTIHSNLMDKFVELAKQAGDEETLKRIQEVKPQRRQVNTPRGNKI